VIRLRLQKELKGWERRFMFSSRYRATTPYVGGREKNGTVSLTVAVR